MTDSDRLLTFEIDGSIFALPIHGVLEVAEGGRITCIPTIASDTAGVMNWHGDALPVVAPRHVLGREAPEERTALASEHVVVVSDRNGESALLGIPVDRVLGLVDGSVHRGQGGGELIVERRRVRGRVVSVLDPRQWVAQAESVIQSAAH
ncbi:MAG: chemotaxis protein CheW [Myxococcota bacterium]